MKPNSIISGVLCLGFCAAMAFASSAVQSDGVRLVCDLPAVDHNPRNGEGDFVKLNDGSILFAYGKFVGKNEWDATPATIMSRVSRDAVCGKVEER